MLLFAPSTRVVGADGPLPPRVTPDPAWTAVFDRTAGWTGADAAGSVDLGDGRTLWMFADTWIGKIREGKRLPGAWIVNNTIAIHPTDKSAPWRPPDPHTVQFYWGPLDKERHPTAWLVPPTAPGRVESEENREWVVSSSCVARAGLFRGWFLASRGPLSGISSVIPKRLVGTMFPTSHSVLGPFVFNSRHPSVVHAHAIVDPNIKRSAVRARCEDLIPSW
jgi:hypothetical protein